MSDVVICPACETENPSENRYCEVCGAELHAHTADLDEGEQFPVSEPGEFPEGGATEYDISAVPDEAAQDFDEQAQDFDEDFPEGGPTEYDISAVPDASEDGLEDDDLGVMEGELHDLESFDDQEEVDAFGDDEPPLEAVAAGEPGDFDDEPSDFDDEPGDFDDEPSDFDDEPGDFDDEPGDFGDEPGDFDDEPDDFDEVGYDEEATHEEPLDEPLEPEEPPAPSIDAHRITESVTIEVAPLPIPSSPPLPPSLAVFIGERSAGLLDLHTPVTYLGAAPSFAPPSPPQETLEAPDEPADPAVFDDFDDTPNVDEQELHVEDAPESFDEGDEMLDSIPETVDASDEAAAHLSEADEDSFESLEGADESEATEEDASVAATSIDLAELTGHPLAQKHIAIFQQNRNFTLYVLADEPTQLNDELLSLGESRSLSDGDIIVLGEAIALRFDLDAA